jgi:hypothetical protein
VDRVKRMTNLGSRATPTTIPMDLCSCGELAANVKIRQAKRHARKYMLLSLLPAAAAWGGISKPIPDTLLLFYRSWTVKTSHIVSNRIKLVPFLEEKCPTVTL